MYIWIPYEKSGSLTPTILHFPKTTVLPTAIYQNWRQLRYGGWASYLGCHVHAASIDFSTCVCGNTIVNTFSEPSHVVSIIISASCTNDMHGVRAKYTQSDFSTLIVCGTVCCDPRFLFCFFMRSHSLSNLLIYCAIRSLMNYISSEKMSNRYVSLKGPIFHIII